MTSPVSKTSSMCWMKFNTWAVQYLLACSGNGRQAVQYQALVQFVEGHRREIGLNLVGLDGPIPGFRRATTRACLQSLGKRCVLAAHALSRPCAHCIVTGPKSLISSVRISSSPVAFSFFRCFNEFCSSMVVKSSSKPWFSRPCASFDIALSVSVWYVSI